MCRHSLSVAGFLIAAGLLVSEARAVELPARKAGLWEIKTVFEGRKTTTSISQTCIDASTDKLLNSINGDTTKEMCSKNDIRQSGTGYVVDSVCKIGNYTTTGHAVMTGDFHVAYTVKVSSKTEGGPTVPGQVPGRTSNMTIEARWLGPCKADQKPGDIIMSNGMKVNVKDMKQP